MARKRAVKRGVLERDNEAVFLEELSRHGSVRKACFVATVTRAWVRNQLKDNDEFAQKYADALEDSVDRVEEMGNNMARTGDDKMIRYLLDARRYKKNVEVDLGEVKPIINITIGVKPT